MINREGTSPDEAYLLSLTEFDVMALLAVAEELGFRATWDYPNDSDWELISDRVDAMHARLLDVATLQDVVDAIYAVGGGAGPNTIVLDCCGSETVSSQPVIPMGPVRGQGLVPSAVVDAGHVSTENDWDGFESYLCTLAPMVVDGMLAKVDELKNLVVGGTLAVGTVAAALATFATGGVLATVAVLLAEAAAIYSAAAEIADALELDPLTSQLLEYRDEIECIIKNASSAREAARAIKVLLQNDGGIGGALLPLFPWEATLNAVYEGVGENGEAIAASVIPNSDCGVECADMAVRAVVNGTIIQASDGTTYVPGQPLVAGQRVRVVAAVNNQPNGIPLRDLSIEMFSLDVNEPMTAVSISTTLVDGAWENTSFPNNPTLDIRDGPSIVVMEEKANPFNVMGDQIYRATRIDIGGRGGSWTVEFAIYPATVL